MDFLFLWFWRGLALGGPPPLHLCHLSVKCSTLARETVSVEDSIPLAGLGRKRGVTPSLLSPAPLLGPSSAVTSGHWFLFSIDGRWVRVCGDWRDG